MAPRNLQQREIERLQSSLETVRLREKEASGRADIHLRNLNAARAREDVAGVNLVTANAKIAELEALVAEYKEKIRNLELRVEGKMKALGFEERDLVEEGEKEHTHEEVSVKIGKSRESCDHAKGQTKSLHEDKKALKEALGVGEARVEAVLKEQQFLQASGEETKKRLDEMTRQERKHTMTEHIYQEVKARVEDVMVDHDRSDEGLRDQAHEDGKTGAELVERLIGKYDQLINAYSEVKERPGYFTEEITGRTLSHVQMAEEYNARNREYNDLIQHHGSLVEKYDSSVAKEEERNKALKAAETRHEELSGEYSQLLLVHGHLTLEHENDRRALQAAEASNQANKERIDAMNHDLLQLRLKWMT